MRIWIDTEFNEYHGALISMALVADDGREAMAVHYDHLCSLAAGVID